MDKTIEYYDVNAKEYFEKTVIAEMGSIYGHFTRFLKPGYSICDLGCGSGRDSKYFMSRGFIVVPIDGSLEMCKLASNFLKHEVICQKFDEIGYKDEFDAIWACASLLHVQKNKLSDIIEKLVQAARNGAVIYFSFKIGASERIVDGRFFSEYNQNEMLNLILQHEKSLKLIEFWVSDDVINPLERTQWLNLIVRIIK